MKRSISSAVPAVVVPSSVVAPLVPSFPTFLGGYRVSVVDARNLHQVLGVVTDFSDWIKRRIEEYGFVEGKDYKVVNLAPQNWGAKHGGHNRKDYHISLYMAQHLSIVERTPKGQEIRDYFLEIERRYMSQLQSLSAIPYDTVPKDCTTRPLIKTRAQLSFRTTDENGNAVMALADCRAAWDVPRGLSASKSRQIGKQYFAELQELAEQNPEEAKSALIELFLFGWRTPMQIKQPKTTEKVGLGYGEQVTVLKKDAWVNPDVVRDYGLEWSFLEALAAAALTAKTEGV